MSVSDIKILIKHLFLFSVRVINEFLKLSEATLLSCFSVQSLARSHSYKRPALVMTDHVFEFPEWQPRSQGLSGGGKMRDPGNEVARVVTYESFDCIDCWVIFWPRSLCRYFLQLRFLFRSTGKEKRDVK